MADTVITPVARDDGAANALGWAIAIVLLLGIILFGLFVWPGIGSVAPSAPANTNSGIDVNVRLPEGVVPSTNNSGTQNNGTNQGTQGNQQGTQMQ